MSAKKILVFIEFKEEAENFKKNVFPNITKEDVMVVTFHPVAKHYLNGINIQINDSFTFCDQNSHYKLIHILQDFTDTIRTNCKFTHHSSQNDIYTDNLLFHLRAIMSTWLYRVEVISNAIEYFNPNKIITFSGNTFKVEKTVRTGRNERYLDDIISQLTHGDLEAENLKVEVPKSRGKNSYFVQNKHIIGRLGSKLKSLKKNWRPKVLIPEEGYSMSNIFKLLSAGDEDDYDLCFLGRPLSMSRSKLQIHNGIKGKNFRYLYFNADKKCVLDEYFIKEKENYKDRFGSVCKKWEYRGVKPEKYVLNKYEHALAEEVLDNIYYNRINLEEFFKNEKPDCVFSQYSRGLTSVVGEICEENNIPSVMVPHGSFTPVYDQHSKMELKESIRGMLDTKYKYLCFQTPLIEEFIKEIPIKSEKVVTGPLIFGTKVKKGKDVEIFRKKFAEPEDKIIMHASTFKGRSGQRLVTYLTIDEYVEEIISLINVIDRLEGVHLIVRHRPNYDLSETEICRLLPGSSKYSIVSDGCFLDYLSISDLLVSYSSSTLVEALQNNIPVLVYNRFKRYEYLAGKRLDANNEYDGVSAVYAVDSDDHLFDAISWILNNHLKVDNGFEPIYDGYKYKNEEIVGLKDFVNKIIYEKNPSENKEGIKVGI